MQSLDLFSGAGGMALGVERAGFRHLALIEKDPYCCETLRSSKPSWPVLCEDTRRVRFDDFSGAIDLLTAGPPCQPFSAASCQYGRGGDDERNCFPDFLKAVRAVRPRAFILENVPGLSAPRNRPYLDRILGQLSQGYRVAWTILNACEFGVAQNRRRFVCLGIRRDLGIDPRFPSPVERRLVLRDILRVDDLDAPWFAYPGGRGAKVFNGHPRELKLVPWRPHSKAERKAVIRKGQDPDEPTDTLKSTQSKMGDRALCVCAQAPDGKIYVQALGVAACAALQSFPHDWSFQGGKTRALSQIGNAVPPTFALELARTVRDQLGEKMRHRPRPGRAVS
jgi:DNA (cytosine-5)-methyltransferase 1